jgi:hypothetical protein
MALFEPTRRHFVAGIVTFISVVNILVFNRNFLPKIGLQGENALNTKAKIAHNATTVAFVVTITGCDTHFGREKFYAFDGAAVLAHSVHKNSIHGPNGGKYDYDLYVFHHPDASECAIPLKKLGYIVQERDTPVAMPDIRNEEFRAHIQTSGCCGERELIKFEVFTLTEYPVAVLLDADTLVLKPLDRLFDSIIDAEKVPDLDDLMYHGIAIPERIDLLYTDDNPAGNAWLTIMPTQGGFAVVRPNISVYNDIVEIVKEGDFRLDGSGWGGRIPMFWGGMSCVDFEILFFLQSSSNCLF